MKPTLLILAAGLGSRYGSLKQLDRIGPSGETIIDYSIYDAIRTGFGKVIFVINKKTEPDFKEVFIDKLKDRIEIDYVLQEIDKIPAGITYTPERKKPWGTGHAILMAAGKIHEPFAMINADDFYGQSAYRSVAAYYKGWTPGRENDYSMVGYDINNCLSDNGTVSRGVCVADSEDKLIEVIERTQIRKVKNGIAFIENGLEVLIPEDTLVSMNFWGFTPSIFGHLEKGFHDFIVKNAQDPKAEYYIPFVVNELVKSGTVDVSILKSSSKWYGMTYREDRDDVAAGILELIAKGEYPQDLWK